MIKKLNFNIVYLSSFIALVILSWVRFGISSQLKVDDVKLESIWGVVVSIVFIISIGIHFYSFWKLKLDEIDWNKYAHGLNFIALFMLPCISNDLFSLLGYGEAFDYTKSVFSNPIKLDSYFSPYVSKLYTEIPNVYGVGSLILGKMAIDTSSVIFSIFKFKFICFLLVSVAITLIQKTKNIEVKNIAFVLLNPLWTIQALGQSHTEVLGVSLLFISIFCINRRWIWTSAFVFGLAVMTKISIVICLIILAYYFKIIYEDNLKNRIIFLAKYSIVGIGFLALIYVFFGNFEILTLPLQTLNSLWPTGSFSAYIYELSKLAQVRNLEKYTIFQMCILKIISVLYFIILFIKYKKTLNQNLPILKFGALISILLIYSHRYMTWYLILVLPIFLFSSDKNWKKVFCGLALAGTLQDASYFNQLESISLPLLIISIAGIIVYQIKILSLPFKNQIK